MTPAPFAAELDKLSAALGRPFDVPGAKRYRVRVARSGERRRTAVLRALPAGAQRAESQHGWLRAVRENAELGRLRADTRATTLEVARLLAWTADWQSMTTRPTWGVLVERSGRSRATVGRALLRLRAAGLLGVVATGRSADYATSREGGAEAAVYVLAEPIALRAVEEHETPTASGLACDPPHAGAREANSSSEPLRGAPVAAPAAPSGPAPAVAGPDARPNPAVAGSVCRPPATARELRLDERLAPARSLQSRLSVLTGITDRHVASVIREYVLAGWTTSDLAHAVDWRPDGTRWPHDGADGVGNLGAWLAYRLAAWRDAAGTVQPSRSRRLELERHERAARRRVEREAAAAHIPAGVDSPALAAIRATIAARPTWRNR